MCSSRRDHKTEIQLEMHGKAQRVPTQRKTKGLLNQSSSNFIRRRVAIGSVTCACSDPLLNVSAQNGANFRRFSPKSVIIII